MHPQIWCPLLQNTPGGGRKYLMQLLAEYKCNTYKTQCVDGIQFTNFSLSEFEIIDHSIPYSDPRSANARMRLSIVSSSLCFSARSSIFFCMALSLSSICLSLSSLSLSLSSIRLSLSSLSLSLCSICLSLSSLSLSLCSICLSLSSLSLSLCSTCLSLASSATRSRAAP